MLVAAFEHDYAGPRMVVVRLADEILDAAASYPARYGLRAYDAVQLATAVAARRADPTCARFVCADRALADAAAAEAFEVVVPG